MPSHLRCRRRGRGWWSRLLSRSPCGERRGSKMGIDDLISMDSRPSKISAPNQQRLSSTEGFLRTRHPVEQQCTKGSSTYLLQARLVNLAQHPSSHTRRGAFHRLHPRPSPHPAMSPPCQSFPFTKLPVAIQADANGKRRKTVDGHRIDLRNCELLELTQYECLVLRPEIRNSPVQCWPIQRLFRQ